MEWHWIVITITYSFSSQRTYVNITTDIKFSELHMATSSTNLSESGEMDCSDVPEDGSSGEDSGNFGTSGGTLNDYGHVDI